MSRSRRNKYPKEGDILSGYIIGKTLGQGAFGKVKLALKQDDPSEFKVIYCQFTAHNSVNSPIAKNLQL